MLLPIIAHMQGEHIIHIQLYRRQGMKEKNKEERKERRKKGKKVR